MISLVDGPGEQATTIKSGRTESPAAFGPAVSQGVEPSPLLDGALSRPNRPITEFFGRHAPEILPGFEEPSQTFFARVGQRFAATLGPVAEFLGRN